MQFTPEDSSTFAETEEATTNNPFAGKLPIAVALNELRLRLLDLTARNRLINFKHTAGKSLQFVHSSIDGVFHRLTTDVANKVAIAALPEPSKADWVSRNGRLSRPEPKDHASQIGIDPSYELLQRGRREITAANGTISLRTLFYAEDLGRHCRKLEREAKLAIEETGANMLYLVLGFLEYPESADSDKLLRAPLLCTPVAFGKTQVGQYTSFHLTYTGDEITDNLSLHEKVKRDYSLLLPQYDAEAEGSVEDYFDAVSDAVAALPNWRVRRMMTLTLLSFTNMLLVRDLDPDNWPMEGDNSSLLTHPLVRQVFEGRESGDEAEYAEEYPIDEHAKGDLPLIYDADSSQHSALIDVLEGKNSVIEGPPGTGKSQTITNLIAAALQSGKKVLFVAEKLAALSVVKSRLQQAGLDSFVLELHSNKTNKKRVLEDLSERIQLPTPHAGNLLSLLQQLEQKRAELKNYANLLNSKVANELELTLHHVMWRTERHRMECGDCASQMQSLHYLQAPRTDLAQLSALRDRLRSLAGHIAPIGTYGPSHPLWGFFPEELKPEDDIPVKRTLSEFADRFASFATAAADAAKLLGGARMNMSASSAQQLLSLLQNVAPAEVTDIDYSLLPALFPGDDPTGRNSLSVLEDLQQRQRRLDDTEAALKQHLHTSEAADVDAATTAQELLGTLRALGLENSSQVALEAAISHLRQAAQTTNDALEDLKAYCSQAGLGFSDSQESITTIKAVSECASKAPQHLAHFRHEGLRNKDAVAVLRDAQHQLEQLQHNRAKREAYFYADLLPSETALKQAILTLREGHAWYRVFQTEWRQAVALHRRLERSKSKRKPAERLVELEDLLQQQASEKAWPANTALQAAAGPHFNAEQTPLRDLLSCADWVQASLRSLEAVMVPLDVFDPVGVDRAKLGRLANHAAAVQSASSVLDRLYQVFRQLLSGAQPRVLREFDSFDWRQRAERAEHVASDLERIVKLMGQRVRSGVSAQDGLQAIVQSQDLRAQELGLTGHSAGRSLLAHRFLGRQTNLTPALAAHTYGKLVKKAGLPAAIERVLVSDECVESHRLLSAYTQAVNEGWKWESEFAQAMGKFGRFEPSAWNNPAGKATTDYAQALAEKTRLASQNVGALLPWAQYVGARRHATDLGLSDFVTHLEGGAVPNDKLDHAFLYRFYASIAQAAFEQYATLRQFSGVRHSDVRRDFGALDREIIQLRGKQVARDCMQLSNPPVGTRGVRVDDKSEMTLLRFLLPQQRPRVTVRRMLKRAGRAIQELKPCFMMGPQAVAQFLEPGHLHFDLVVMDEASQLRPEEAIGTIARGSQLVVVGDPKQLPPTSFFSRMGAGDADGDGDGQMATSDAESILDICISHFQPVRTLRWHYRSRHESLIAFSNHHFYRGKLLVFPSPYPQSKALGLRYHYVSDAAYENQMNPVEARLVVDAAVEHILQRPEDSLGIVTLNIKQRELISELLEERLRGLAQAVEFRQKWESLGYDLFVKNLETVQGDERDCILISTTFGKPKGVGVVRQTFGPITRQGGWRRLNVLFTRARKSVAIYSSMRPEDIQDDAQTPEGTKALRNYLAYARDGVLPVEELTNLPPDSDFEVAVMDVLCGRGYEVTPQLGVAGFRIDIAVRHPLHRSGYLAAVECDGASYHSGVSVRDRDRIRQEILESLGWRDRIWRIWSTDWFRNPLAETEKLVQFLESLKSKPLPEEYLVSEEESPSHPPPSAEKDSSDTATRLQDEAQEEAQGLVLADEDEALEVTVGDLVAFSSTEAPEHVLHVRLTLRQTDPAAGLVAATTPLGTVLMGATVGETVVLRVPSKPSQTFVIRGIKRAEEAVD